MREASEKASGSVGLLISMGQVIASDEFGQMFRDHYIPFVIKELGSLSYRVQRSYALVLSITDEV